jgi:septum formation protein
MFMTEPPEIDETQEPEEEPAHMVLRLASEKSEVSARPNSVVLAADTIVVLDGEVLGKPTNRDHALQMLRRMEGRTHSVLTGWSVRSEDDERFGVAESRVTFSSRTEAELGEYVDRVEPYDKAGAYALQGDDGWLVASVSGSRANVMGLPLAEIAAALLDFGIERSTTHG